MMYAAQLDDWLFLTSDNNVSRCFPIGSDGDLLPAPRTFASIITVPVREGTQ